MGSCRIATVKNENRKYANRLWELTKADDDTKLWGLYEYMQKLYASAVSHFLVLIAAWLAFVYALGRNALDPLLSFTIGFVLIIMGLFSWLRILNLSVILHGLEKRLGLIQLKKSLEQLTIMKKFFPRKRFKNLSIGEWIGTFLLLTLYVVTIFYILSVYGIVKL